MTDLAGASIGHTSLDDRQVIFHLLDVARGRAPSQWSCRPLSYL
jgi:hypothetical protein